MKLPFILSVALFAVTWAEETPVVHTGDSYQYRNQDDAGNYAFGYEEDHVSGGSFRREQADASGHVTGSYGLRDADGRVRIVNYVADENGFRADIKTNEPGVDDSQDPADTTINKEHHPSYPATIPTNGTANKTDHDAQVAEHTHTVPTHQYHPNPEPYHRPYYYIPYYLTRRQPHQEWHHQYGHGYQYPQYPRDHSSHGHYVNGVPYYYHNKAGVYYPNYYYY